MNQNNLTQQRVFLTDAFLLVFLALFTQVSPVPASTVEFIKVGTSGDGKSEVNIDINGDKKTNLNLRGCANKRRAHLAGKFSACFYLKTPKATKDSGTFEASTSKKFVRKSAHFI